MDTNRSVARRAGGGALQSLKFTASMTYGVAEAGPRLIPISLCSKTAAS